jgi:ribosome biogenesis protein BMS1
LAQSKFKLFSQTEAITNEDFERTKSEQQDHYADSEVETNEEIDGDEMEDEGEESEGDVDDERFTDHDEEEEEDSSDEDDNEENGDERDVESDDGDSEDEMYGVKWKKNMQLKASLNFEKSKKINWVKMVYGNDQDLTNAYNASQTEMTDGNKQDNEFGGLFKVTKKEQPVKSDNSQFLTALKNWTLEENLDTISDCFVTGKWEKDKNAKDLLDGDDEVNESDFDDDFDEEGFVDLEDLAGGKASSSSKRKIEEDGDDMDDSGDDEDGEGNEKEGKGKQLNKRERLLEKKKRQKEQFDAAFDSKELDNDKGETGESAFYDALKKETEEQSSRNRMEFEKMDDSLRVQYEGFRPGMYIRVQIKNMPFEFVKNFNAKYLVIIGGLSVNEANIGYVQVRLKKHRWYEKVLKTNDPLIISLGWRRFQTVPLYFIQDHNMRNRSLKYTPQHMHCHASFWGPITPQNNGFLAIQSLANDMVATCR